MTKLYIAIFVIVGAILGYATSVLVFPEEKTIFRYQTEYITKTISVLKEAQDCKSSGGSFSIDLFEVSYQYDIPTDRYYIGPAYRISCEKKYEETLFTHDVPAR